MTQENTAPITEKSENPYIDQFEEAVSTDNWKWMEAKIKKTGQEVGKNYTQAEIEQMDWDCRYKAKAAHLTHKKYQTRHKIFDEAAKFTMDMALSFVVLVAGLSFIEQSNEYDWHKSTAWKGAGTTFALSVMASTGSVYNKRRQELANNEKQFFVAAHNTNKTLLQAMRDNQHTKE